MMKKYNRKRTKMNTHIRTNTLVLKVKKRPDQDSNSNERIEILVPYRLTLMYCCLSTELQRRLSKLLKVIYIVMIMYYVTSMIPL